MSTLMSRSLYETSLAQREVIEAVDATSGQPAIFVKPVPKLASSTARLDDRRLSTINHGQKPGLERTVFYVDENAKALRLLAFVLDGCGYKVVKASSFAEVLVWTRQTSYDLFLLACRRPQTICSNLVLEINQKGLEDALRGILDAGGNITHDWPLERALKVGDKRQARACWRISIPR
jgi:hypothetical protein